MYPAKSSLFQKIDECIKQNHDFSMKIHRFSSVHPHWRFVIWCSNSLDETATQLRILDRGVDFLCPESRIFECMQRNHNFFIELTNAYKKSMTPIEDSRSDPQIPLTKRPLHFGSVTGVSVSEASQAKFSNVCSEIITFSKNDELHKSITFL